MIFFYLYSFLIKKKEKKQVTCVENSIINGVYQNLNSINFKVITTKFDSFLYLASQLDCKQNLEYLQVASGRGAAYHRNNFNWSLNKVQNLKECLLNRFIFKVKLLITGLIKNSTDANATPLDLRAGSLPDFSGERQTHFQNRRCTSQVRQLQL